MTLALAPNAVIFLFDVVQVLFAMAFGACVGSLTNVLVYRLPRGLDVVVPTSRCPNCGTKLTWRENIPVLGWLMLRGRCRFCWSRISAEYPIVEASLAIFFGLLYVLWFSMERSFSLGGIRIGLIKPEWATGGFRETWPMFVIAVTMATCVFAMALTDIKTCTVPLVLAWVATAIGVIGHPLHGLLVSLGRGRLSAAAPGFVWTIPTPGPQDWWWIGAALGGGAGVLIANGLLAAGLIGRSFADYEAWEKQALAEQAAQAQQAAAAAEAGEPAGEPISEPISEPMGDPSSAPISDPSSDPVGHPNGQAADHPTDLWVRYPHARREMLKELVFLAPIVAMAWVGGWLAVKYGGSNDAPAGLAAVVAGAKVAPLWLVALSGSLLGYLVGGGVVWGFRVLGSLGFGKEAVGLGDVHLMAAVGACLGWVDATLAFFLSAFVGLAWVLAGLVLTGQKRRAMAFVPSLAAATFLVLLGKPLIEAGLGVLMQRPVNIP